MSSPQFSDIHPHVRLGIRRQKENNIVATLKDPTRSPLGALGTPLEGWSYGVTVTVHLTHSAQSPLTVFRPNVN